MAIRMTAQTCLVLAALNTVPPEEWLYGMQITELTGIGTGAVHPILARCHDEGLLLRMHECGSAKTLRRPLRTFYSLTPAGRALIDEALERLHEHAAAIMNVMQRQQT